jgi:BirA family transcriptional regulator, biotin operon repressor / biotin---[acetyl-CoA-carboxylase] ligase
MGVSDLSPASVEPLLQGRLGRPYRFVEECASTQRLLGPAEAEGTTVATDLQTQGRGRLGRSWEAPAGQALLFSVLLRPRPPMAIWPELSLVAGDAVAAALRAETGVAAELSHPNDVLVVGKKLAGILPEASSTAGGGAYRQDAGGSDGGGFSHPRLVLGIGVNVNQAAEELPAETPKPATALRVETGREWERAPLLAAILLELEHRYDDWQRLHTNR